MDAVSMESAYKDVTRRNKYEPSEKRKPKGFSAADGFSRPSKLLAAAFGGMERELLEPSSCEYNSRAFR